MKVKLQYGHLIAEFEGNEDEIKVGIDNFLGSVSKIPPNLQKSTEEPRRFTSGTLTARILDLLEEKFLDEPKTLTEITKKLAEQGHHYPVTTVSPTLLQLVRQRRLRRVGEQGNYKYVKP